MSDPNRRLFARDAGSYARYRPDYPDALFAWVAAMSPGHDTAWDCATGSGQAASGLIRHFSRVVASDVSLEQLGSAVRDPRIAYVASSAEQMGLASGSVDTLTIAQGLHWFATDAFFAEARRVLVPGGLIVAWSYHLSRVTLAVDLVVDRFYRDVLGPFWSSPSEQVESAYADLPFPFDQVEPPTYVMTKRWSLADLEGYLGTWSAVSRFRSANGTEPFPLIREELRAAWGAPEQIRNVMWPLAVRAGYSGAAPMLDGSS